MAMKRALAIACCAAALGGCAQVTTPGELTTGSILPALPSASTILPSASALVPTLGPTLSPKPPERISGNLYRIDATDRKLDDTIQRENYALLRAAESAKQLGATHFIVVNAPPGDIRLPSPAQTNGMIRIFRLDPGAVAPTGAIAADEIINFFGPTFGRTAGGETVQPASPQG